MQLLHEIVALLRVGGAAVRVGPLGGEQRGGPIVTKTLMISSRGGASVGEGASADPDDVAGPCLIAYDKATGEEVAYCALPGPPLGVPMTYLFNGKQHIALTLSGSPPKMVTLALPNPGATPARRGR